MKRLCLLRHAKSEWGNAAVEDHDRGLNERGEDTAAFMADFMCENGFTPDTILCSTAKRARLTLGPIQEKLGDKAQVLIEDALYLPMPDEILERIHDIPDSAETVLIISHNPGLEMLSIELMQCEKPTQARVQFEHFPTASYVVYEFDCDCWADIGKGKGRLVHFSKPRDLMES